MPDRRKLKLRAHQQENLDYFRSKSRAFSLLPFGSGKTPICVLRIGDLMPRRALVVTTTGTLYKWMRELRTWGDPEWTCIALHGRRAQRLRAFKAPHNVAVINYEGLRIMIEAYGESFLKAYQVKIFDEIHRLKNPDSDIAKDSALISHPDFADYVYGITGSPVLESPLDLFSLFRVVNPYLFGSDFEKWRDRYFTLESEEKPDGSKGFPKWVCRPGAMDFLAEKLHEISFRREKSEVEVEYPVQLFESPLMLELKGAASRAYAEAEHRLMLAVRDQVIPLVNIYPRIEKLCQLARGWCYDKQKRPIFYPGPPGIAALCEYMEDVRGSGRIAIWAVRPPDMSMIAGALERMGRTYRIIFGGINNLKKREEICESFNDGYIDALIAHPRCLGEGVDLEAGHSLRYSYRWSATEYDQTIGRFARMTSSAPCVKYTDMVCKDTIDMGIMTAVRRKLDIGEMIKKYRRLPWKTGPVGGAFDDDAA